MPFDIAVLPVFLAVSFVLLITPGPDAALVVATGVTEGRRPALWASVGMALAMFAHAVFAAAGVAAIIATSPIAFDLIRVGGAGYLIYLAVKSFRSQPFKPGEQVTSRSPMVNFQRGFLTNLLNPKRYCFQAYFCLNLRPQPTGQSFNRSSDWGQF